MNFHLVRLLSGELSSSEAFVWYFHQMRLLSGELSSDELPSSKLSSDETFVQ